MITDIAAVEEMLEVLDANPNLLEALRARILTRELLELPQAVAELSASQIRLETTLREFMKATNARLDSLETTLREFMEATNARFVSLETTLREFMEATKAFMEAANTRLAKLESNVVEIKRDFSVIKGRHVEMDLQGKIHGMLGIRRLNRAQVVRAGYPAVALPAFCEDMYNALETGLVTDEQYGRVMDTDLIARARRRGFDDYVYVAVEASYQLDKDDVDRVDRTARTLAAVFPKAEIIAMVYGVETSGDVMFHAESKGIETLLGRSS